jgi:hypothetical protein
MVVKIVSKKTQQISGLQALSGFLLPRQKEKSKKLQKPVN